MVRNCFPSRTAAASPRAGFVTCTKISRRTSAALTSFRKASASLSAVRPCSPPNANEWRLWPRGTTVDQTARSHGRLKFAFVFDLEIYGTLCDRLGRLFGGAMTRGLERKSKDVTPEAAQLSCGQGSAGARSRRRPSQYRRRPRRPSSAARGGCMNILAALDDRNLLGASIRDRSPGSLGGLCWGPLLACRYPRTP